jgi:hypothetical protein
LLNFIDPAACERRADLKRGGIQAESVHGHISPRRSCFSGCRSLLFQLQPYRRAAWG